jgi:hypothetical protein
VQSEHCQLDSGTILVTRPEGTKQKVAVMQNSVEGTFRSAAVSLGDFSLFGDVDLEANSNHSSALPLARRRKGVSTLLRTSAEGSLVRVGLRRPDNFKVEANTALFFRPQNRPAFRCYAICVGT